MIEARAWRANNLWKGWLAISRQLNGSMSGSGCSCTPAIRLPLRLCLPRMRPDRLGFVVLCCAIGQRTVAP